jgi:hypothetical protein
MERSANLEIVVKLDTNFDNKDRYVFIMSKLIEKHFPGSEVQVTAKEGSIILGFIADIVGGALSALISDKVENFINRDSKDDVKETSLVEIEDEQSHQQSIIDIPNYLIDRLQENNQKFTMDSHRILSRESIPVIFTNTLTLKNRSSSEFSVILEFKINQYFDPNP